MARTSRCGLLSKSGILKLVLILLLVLVLILVTAILVFVGPVLNSKAQASCPSCDCDCFAEEKKLSLPFDCGKNDTEMTKEMGKDLATLISEELKLHEDVTKESLKHSNSLISAAQKSSSQYRKEAEKCIAGMQTCEGAREKAQADLIDERKLTDLWEKRACELGWKDERTYTNDNE